MCLALAACQPRAERVETPPTGEPAVPDEDLAVAVSVYFPDDDLEHLEAEARDVLPADAEPASLARAAVEVLFAGPEEEGHIRALPESVEVHDVTLDGTLATVDLSQQFVDDFQGGSNVASLAVYSIVHTLCAIEGIEKVRILIDGQSGGEFGGVVDLHDILEPDPALIGGERL